MGPHDFPLLDTDTLAWVVVTALLVASAVWNIVLRRELRRRRQAEAESLQREQQIQTLAHARKRFIAYLGHEMRNLVSGIFGTLALTDAERRHLDPAQLNRALRNDAQALLDLVDASLDAAQIDAGRFAVRATVVDVAALLEGIALAAQPQFQGTGVPKVELGFARGSLWVIDGVRLAQIVRNLVSNAIKYADGADVRITADVSSEPMQSRLCVRVIDAGPGLTPAQCERAFDEFERVGDSAQISGRGLGLAISCQLAQAMGGKLSVRSEPGVGSVFAVALPITPVCGQHRSAWPTSACIQRPALRNPQFLNSTP